MGAGKTTLSKVIHDKLKHSALVGLDWIKWFVSGYRRNKADNRMTRNVVFAMVNGYLRQGISVILEQTLKPREVLALRKLAKKYDVSFFMYQLSASRHILLNRINERPRSKTGRPKIAPSRILRNLRMSDKIKYTDVTEFDTQLLSTKQIANRILKDIRVP